MKYLVKYSRFSKTHNVLSIDTLELQSAWKDSRVAKVVCRSLNAAHKGALKMKARK